MKPVAYIKTIALSALAGTMFFLSTSVFAQVYLGGDDQPSIEVDLNVLNSLPNTGGAPATVPAMQSYSTPDHEFQKYTGGTPTPYSQINRRTQASLNAPSMPLGDTTQDLNRIESEDLPPTKISYTAPTTTAGVPTNIPGMPQVQTQSVPATGALEAGHTPPQALNMPGTPTVTAMSVPPANTTPTGIAASPLPPASGAMSQALNAAVTNAGPLTADDLRLGFKGAEESLPTDQTGKLERLAAKLKNNPDLRVELRSFASAGSDMGSKARRLSLSRALMVRTALTQRGVDVDRIDVRALGAATDPSDADTVDVFLVR